MADRALSRPVKRRSGRLLRAALSGLLAVSFLAACGWYGYFHRPLPGPVHRELFPGVVYSRQVYRLPRPMIVHFVDIDLDAPGIGFIVTPEDHPDSDTPLAARTTSQFLREFDVEVAVNGDFFQPFYSKGFWRYYPHVGDPVHVEGTAGSRGIIYSRKGRDTLYLSRDNRASFHKPMGAIYNAISGYPMLVADAKNRFQPRFSGPPLPCTALALDRRGRRLMIAVIDGRQPNYSEGATESELADLIIAHGGYAAVKLDGGGSTTLVIRGVSGRPVILNSPINHRIPGWERPVANHLGVFARGRSR